MKTKDTLTLLNSIHSDLKIIKELVYDKCGFDFTNLKLNLESEEYGACTFVLNGNKIQYRASKITPTKTGQFVAIWKRNQEGITQPFDIFDDVDFIIITSKSDNNFGQFIIPKMVLVDRGKISSNDQIGKRGIRVYPPWDMTLNKQAQKTQMWQTKYFITIEYDGSTYLNLLKKLLAASSNETI